MQLLGNGLTSDDPVLAGVCDRLRPFQEKLGQVDRGLVQKGLALVSANPSLADEEAAKECLVGLVDKLNSMRWLFGIA